MSSPDDHPHVKFAKKNEYLHRGSLVDSQLANFLTFMVEYHALKQNKIECNLRAAQCSLSFCRTRHGLI